MQKQTQKNHIYSGINLKCTMKDQKKIVSLVCPYSDTYKYALKLSQEDSSKKWNASKVSCICMKRTQENLGIWFLLEGRWIYTINNEAFEEFLYNSISILVYTSNTKYYFQFHSEVKFLSIYFVCYVCMHASKLTLNCWLLVYQRDLKRLPYKFNEQQKKMLKIIESAQYAVKYNCVVYMCACMHAFIPFKCQWILHY